MYIVGVLKNTPTRNILNNCLLSRDLFGTWFFGGKNAV
jgi:hypothetical protein